MTSGCASSRSTSSIRRGVVTMPNTVRVSKLVSIASTPARSVAQVELADGDALVGQGLRRHPVRSAQPPLTAPVRALATEPGTLSEPFARRLDTHGV